MVVLVCCHDAQVGISPAAQALKGKGGPRRQLTLSIFSCPRMYTDTASQIATTSGKQGRELSGSGPGSSQPLGKLLDQGVTDADVHRQPRQTLPWLRSWAVPQVHHHLLLLCSWAGLGKKWGHGKGSGAGLWPAHPQRGMEPQSPEHDLPAWWHQGIPWEGAEVLPKETGSR